MLALFNRGNGFSRMINIPQIKPVYDIPMPLPVAIYEKNRQFGSDPMTPVPIWQFDYSGTKTVDGIEIAVYKYRGDK